MTDPSEVKRLTDEIERLKFDIRQAMVEYGIACRKDDQEGIRASTTDCVTLLDRLAALAQRNEQREPQAQEAVAEVCASQVGAGNYIVLHGPMPPVGTKLYAAPPASPPGWVLVPVELTRKQFDFLVQAAWEFESVCDITESEAAKIYAAVIAAAPTSPVEGS